MNAKEARALAAAMMGTIAIVGCGGGAGEADAPESLAARGATLARARGCAGCHSPDGTAGVGPSWRGSWGDRLEFDDGRTVVFDESYVAESIRDPAAARRAGERGSMPRYDLPPAEIEAITAYIHSLAD